MAKEGHTDTKGKLKGEIVEVNKRWDALEGRTSAIIRRLQHIINVRDDYNATRKDLVRWLKGIDKRLKAMQPLSDLDIPNQLEKLQVNSDALFMWFFGSYHLSLWSSGKCYLTN